MQACEREKFVRNLNWKIYMEVTIWKTLEYMVCETKRDLQKTGGEGIDKNFLTEIVFSCGIFWSGNGRGIFRIPERPSAS